MPEDITLHFSKLCFFCVSICGYIIFCFASLSPRQAGLLTNSGNTRSWSGTLCSIYFTLNGGDIPALVEKKKAMWGALLSFSPPELFPLCSKRLRRMPSLRWMNDRHRFPSWRCQNVYAFWQWWTPSVHSVSPYCFTACSDWGWWIVTS